MNDESTYDAWRRSRAAVEVDEGLVDRVMDEVRRRERAGASERLRAAGQEGVVWHRYTAAALLLVGLGIGLFRLVAVAALVLFSAREGF